MNYYRLIFESKVLPVLADPIIIENGLRYSKGSTEYYSRFIQGITKRVIEIKLTDNEFVRFDFDDEYSLEIPYLSITGAGIETMVDINDRSKWWAW